MPSTAGTEPNRLTRPSVSMARPPEGAQRGPSEEDGSTTGGETAVVGDMVATEAAGGSGSSAGTGSGATGSSAGGSRRLQCAQVDRSDCDVAVGKK